MTLGELFSGVKTYILEVEIQGTNFYLYIEGLNEYGEAIFENNFSLDKIKNLCIELCEKNEEGIGEFVETIDSLGIELSEKIDNLIERVRLDYEF